MDKRLIRIYSLFMVIAIIIVNVYALKFHGITTKSMYPEDTEVVISPVNETLEPDHEYLITLDASEIVRAGGCLSFTAGFNDVWVYSGEKLIYENIGIRSLFLRSNGNAWHFVRVDDANEPVTVKLKSVYDDDATMKSPEFSAGDYYNIRWKLISGSTLVLFTSILDILFGFAMIVYSILTRRVNPDRPRIIFIGITALLIGLWSSGETNASVVLVSNRGLAGVFAFLSLIFIPIPYVMYIHEVLWPKDKHLYKIPICLSLLDFVAVMVLAILGVMDLRQSVIITHLTWGIAIIYVIAAAINVLRTPKAERGKMAMFNAASMLVLIAVAGLEIGYYWTGVRLQNDVLGRILILAYIVLLAYKNILESLKEIEKGKMAEYYKDLANTDAMTGLANRTKFNHDIEKLTQEKEYSIISMDLNNLKEVNDTKGHQAGDRYIIGAARIIKKVFGKEGTCYRIGGDEFSVIIKKEASASIVSDLIPMMDKEIRDYNENNPSEPVAIALGYESKAPESERDYIDILRSADEKMYENKRFLKGQN